MPPAVLDPTFPTNEQPQTHVLDRTTTGFGVYGIYGI
jgi:hypothetical protein